MNRVKRVIHATRQELRGYTGAGVTAAVLDTGSFRAARRVPGFLSGQAASL